MYKVIFLHIPKTAGTTFKQIIKRNYAQNEIFGLNGDEKYQTDQKLNNLLPDKKDKIKFIGGHINFGMHESFNDKHNFKYITFLRDPIQREISYYKYVLRTTRHVHHQEVIANKMTLQDYITSHLYKDLDNAQTKQIAGLHVGLQSKPLHITDDILQKAKNNINDYFIFAGIIESFEEGLILLHKTLNWKFPLYYTSFNINPTKEEKIKTSDKTIQLIIDQNQLDIQLYEYVKNSFMKEIELNKGYINRHKYLLHMFNSLYDFYIKFRNK